MKKTKLLESNQIFFESSRTAESEMCEIIDSKFAMIKNVDDK